VSVRRSLAVCAVGLGLTLASAPAFAQVNGWKGLVSVESVGKQFRVYDPACDGKPVRGEYRFSRTSGAAQGRSDNRSGCGTTVVRTAPNVIHAHRACVIDPGVAVQCSNWWFF
jgi:hypothetical protein